MSVHVSDPGEPYRAARPTTSATNGVDRIEALQQAFAFIPRSIIVKTDLLREGVQYTPLLHEIGRWAIPEFLLWSPEHEQNPRPSANGLRLSPWKLNLTDGTPVKILPRQRSPYQIQREEDGKHWLLRDGVPLEEVTFEKRPEWPLQTTSDGTIMASVFQLEASNCVVGCVLRHCEYRAGGQECRFCCLQSTLDQARTSGISIELAMKPETAVETYRAALREGYIHTVVLTGGTILDDKKEAAVYARIYSQLNEIREETGFQTLFRANPSCFAPDELKTLQDASVDVICLDMEVWDERLRPVICPGKEAHVSRDEFMRRIVKAVEIFGAGNVQSNFVQGITMVCPEGYRSQDDSIRSELAGYEWCLQNRIYPITSQWLDLPGTAYCGRAQPPTEYFLTLAYERHKLLERYGKDFPYRLIEGHCPRCGHSWTDDDFYFKLHIPQSVDGASTRQTRPLPFPDRRRGNEAC